MAAKTLTTAATDTPDETASGAETATTVETVLGLAQQALDELATLRAEFAEFKNDVERALGDVRSAGPEEFGKLAELVERLRARVLPND